ncbi:MAG: winged helix-turn-helix domain-containing protein [Caldimonas sp.]
MRFGDFELRPGQRVLHARGEPVTLGGRAFDLLLALAQRRGRVVTKQELLDAVWPGLVVEEHNIATQISTLRKALGPQAIATVPGRGYRFTALVEDREIDLAPVPAEAAAKGPTAVPTGLPRRLTPLIGRADDLAALGALLERSRLVTLVGAGGIGKSLLAQHLLNDRVGAYSDGVCWVELASVGDGAALPQRIADALGVRGGAGEPLGGLCAAVSEMTMLVALDNAEHLLADVARIAAALLDAAPGLHLLVTSQAPLQLAAESVYRVGSLPVPQGPLPYALAQTFAAVALFVERACSGDARFVLSDDTAPAAIELCRALDGIPLAIELAAARAPLLGVPQLATSMCERLRLLTRNRDSTAPARQQTLRAALEWSHGLLDERERVVFRRLGVIEGSASLDLIQHVVADDSGSLDAWDVLDALGLLVDRSLVMVLDDPEANEPRYRLLESPRLLAIEQLHAADETDAVRRLHAHALAAAFDEAWDERWSGRIGAQRWAGRVLLDSSNARNAIAWAHAAGEPQVAASIAATLYLALPRSSVVERVGLADLCESLAEQPIAPPLRLRAWMVAVRPMFHHHQQQSLALATKAVALARELDVGMPDRWPLYQALSLWIGAAAIVAQPDAGALREAHAELTTLEDPRWPAQRLAWGLAWIRWIPLTRVSGADQAAQTLAVTRLWVQTVEAAGDDTAHCMGSLLDAELECGHVDSAIRIGIHALEQLAPTRDEWSRSIVQSNLAIAYLGLDDTAKARPLLRAVWPLAQRWNMCAQCADLPPLLAALEGRMRAAAQLTGYADAAVAARALFRHPLEAAARERARELARNALGDTLFQQMLREGGSLRDDQIAALAFGPEDSLGASIT